MVNADIIVMFSLAYYRVTFVHIIPNSSLILYICGISSPDIQRCSIKQSIGFNMNYHKG